MLSHVAAPQQELTKARVKVYLGQQISIANMEELQQHDDSQMINKMRLPRER